MHIEDITPKNNTDTDNEDDIARFDYYRKYYELVKPAFLQPTSIKVDVKLFNEEIKEYHNIFRQWGYNRDHNPRFGISLFNLDDTETVFKLSQYKSKIDFSKILLEL